MRKTSPLIAVQISLALLDEPRPVQGIHLLLLKTRRFSGVVQTYSRSSSQILSEAREILFQLGKHESVKRQKAMWDGFDVDYEKMREESREPQSQYKRMIRAKRKHAK